MMIRSLRGIPLGVLHRSFLEAFSDYAEEAAPTEAQLGYMLERRGYREEVSFGAFDDGELVGFTLNALGDWNGALTAYDTATGVHTSHRKQGVASRIFKAALPELGRRGVRQYLLEAIKTNTGAVDLYRKAGFRVTREFDYWVAAPETLQLDRERPPGIEIVPAGTPDWGVLSRFWDDLPSWQNGIDAVTRVWRHMELVLAREKGTTVAYGLMERDSGDVPQLAVHPAYRRRGIGTALLGHLLARVRPPSLRVINTHADSVPIRSFMPGLGVQAGLGQYEMILEI